MTDSPSIWATLLISFASALAGGLVAHFLSIYRERTAKRRDLVTKHLIEIWNDLDVAGNAKSRSDTVRMERAISNIQLFGSEEMIRAARNNTLEFSAKGATDNLQIMTLLRDQLRSELGLQPTSQKYIALRIISAEDQQPR